MSGKDMKNFWDSRSSCSSESSTESSEPEVQPKVEKRKVESNKQTDTPNYEDSILADQSSTVKIGGSVKYKREGLPSAPNTKRGVIESTNGSTISIKKGVMAHVNITDPNATSSNKVADETDGNIVGRKKNKKKTKNEKPETKPHPQYDPAVHGPQVKEKPVEPKVLKAANDFLAGTNPTNEFMEQYEEQLLAYSAQKNLPELKTYCEVFIKSNLDSRTPKETVSKYRSLAVQYKADDLKRFIEEQYA